MCRQNYVLAMSSPIIYATIASTFIAWNHVGHNDLIQPSYLWRKVPLRSSFIFEQVLSLRLFSLSNVFFIHDTRSSHLLSFTTKFSPQCLESSSKKRLYCFALSNLDLSWSNVCSCKHLAGIFESLMNVWWSQMCHRLLTKIVIHKESISDIYCSVNFAFYNLNLVKRYFSVFIPTKAKSNKKFFYFYLTMVFHVSLHIM